MILITGGGQGAAPKKTCYKIDHSSDEMEMGRYQDRYIFAHLVETKVLFDGVRRVEHLTIAGHNEQETAQCLETNP